MNLLNKTGIISLFILNKLNKFNFYTLKILMSKIKNLQNVDPVWGRIQA